MSYKYKFFAVFLWLVTVASNPVFAAEIFITAKFKPDPLNPNADEFVNTTPVTGLCFRYPNICKDQNIFSIDTGVAFSSVAPIEAYPQDGAYFKLPTSPVDVVVTSSSGKVETVTLRISGFGAEYVLNPGVSVITGGKGHSQLWQNGEWLHARPPCKYTGLAGANDTLYGFFWLFPRDAVCTRKAFYTIPSISYKEVQIAYELKTPKPLEMESGVYTGRVQFSLGKNQDIDFGDSVAPTESVLVINLELEIDHILKVQFPPGADRLSLIPDGGWQQWLYRVRRPEKLFANQPFQFWSSGRFTMKLQCDYTVGEHCGIRNESGHEVPVETRVTLPAGVTVLSGMPVNRQLLSNTNATHFMPTQYVDNGRASLHFEVGRDSVKEMTDHAGSRYSGNVTIMWDSQVDG